MSQKSFQNKLYCQIRLAFLTGTLHYYFLTTGYFKNQFPMIVKTTKNFFIIKILSLRMRLLSCKERSQG